MKKNQQAAESKKEYLSLHLLTVDLFQIKICGSKNICKALILVRNNAKGLKTTLYLYGSIEFLEALSISEITSFNLL